MGRASSAKKIARGARAGAASGPSDRRQLGFPALVGLIIVLGLLLVGFARATRDVQASPTLQDHWHDAYAIYDCSSDRQLPIFTSQADPDGIHSHQDGLIHIHPFTASVTGKEATMRVFLDAMGASLSDETLTLPGGEALVEGVDCGGQPAILQIARWTNPLAGGAPDDIYIENLDGVRFLADGQAFTIALAPEGAEIPLPDTLDELATHAGESRDEGVDPSNDTRPPSVQDFGTGQGPNADPATADDTSDPANPTTEADPAG